MKQSRTSQVMVHQSSKSQADGDDWRAVQDRRKRKQIQDRLAQRARRKRLAQRQRQSHESVAEKGNGSAQTTIAEGGSDSCPRALQTFTSGQRPLTISFGVFAQALPLAVAMSSDLQTPYLPLVTDDQRAQRDTLSVYAALYRNGEILGLTCGQAKHSRSLYTFTNIPQHLRPTNLQRAVLHPDWIDRFPFPHMRDACISSLDTFDEEEFLGDLFMMPSFNIASGYDSHDPHGWAITKEFKQKWGHLFFPGQTKQLLTL